MAAGGILPPPLSFSMVQGTVSRYMRIFSDGSRMRIPNIQSSTWVMWFCDIRIIPLACAWPADVALRPRSGVYFGISWRNQLCEDTGRCRMASLRLSLMCSLRFFGFKRCVGPARSISMGVVCGTQSPYCLGSCTHDVHVRHILRLISNVLK